MLLRLGRLWAAACLVVVLAAAAHAQPVFDQDYTAWQQLQQRVERVLDAGRADEATLERLRADVVSFRDRFYDAEDANQDEIQGILRQLEALGPPPTDGSSETQAIAERRETLDTALADLQRPQLRATEAAVQADMLVGRIDRLVRNRQAERVLERFPTPLNPLHWQVPSQELAQTLLQIPLELAERSSSPQQRREILRNLPLALLSLLAGAAMLFRSRRWSDFVAERVYSLPQGALRSGLRLLIVIAELALPYVGLVLLLTALQLTGLFGPAGTAVLVAGGAFGFFMVVGTWLVRQLLPRQHPENTPLRLLDIYVPKARRMASLLVVLGSLEKGLFVLADRLSEQRDLLDLSELTKTYVGYALAVLTAAALFRLAKLFRRSVAESSDTDSAQAFSDNVVALLAIAGQVIAVGAVIGGAVGYPRLAVELVFPAVTTFFVFGLLVMLQRGVSEVYAMMISGGRQTDAQAGLLPTLLGGLLLLAALPLLALIWGARRTDLSEVWTKIREGFDVGGITISPTVFITLVIVFTLGLLLTRLVQGALKNTLLPKTRLTTGARNAMVSGVGYLGVFAAGLVAVTSAGINLSNLAIFASALAVGVGFGLQTIVSNFVSGIILLIERPVSEGDWIEVNGQHGTVKKISVRSTNIQTFDRSDLIIPNSDLISGVVTNYTKDNLLGRVIVKVGVAYGTDTRKVERVLGEVANAHPMVLLNPPPLVLFCGFGASSLDFELRVILSDVNYSLGVHSDLNHEIARRFTEEEIEVPFPQTDLWVRNADALRPPQLQGNLEPAAPTPKVGSGDTGGEDGGDGPY